MSPQSTSAGRSDARPFLSHRATPGIIAGAIALIVGPVQYMVAETVAAAAWRTPAYSYAQNFISDLGAPNCGTFQGRDICSPLHNVMNAGFVIQGILFAVAGILLFGLFDGKTRYAFLAVALIAGVGFVMVGTFHAGPQSTTASFTLHFVGAFPSLLGGNLVAVLTGLYWLRRGWRRLGAASIALGSVGIVSGFALVGLFESGAPLGLIERASSYPIVIWQLLTGVTLLVERRRGRY